MKYLFAVLMLLLLTGCAQTFTINRHSYYSDFEDVNEQCYGTTNHIHLKDGTTVTTNQLVLAKDSATYVLSDGRRQRVCLWDIRRIDNINHRRGAHSGAFAGILAGAGGGIVVSSHLHTHGTLGALAVTAVTGAASAVGGMAGAAIGSAVGYPTVIKFDSTITSPSDTMHVRSAGSAGWSMPGTTDTTHKR